MLSDATIEVIREALDDASRNARTNIAWYREREARNNGILSMPHIGKLAHYEQVLIANDAALTELDSLAAMPAPDWASAPSWAMFWAVNPTGLCFWFQREPVALSSGYGHWFAEGRSFLSELVELPLGVDWRETLQQRPQEGGAA